MAEIMGRIKMHSLDNEYSAIIDLSFRIVV